MSSVSPDVTVVLLIRDPSAWELETPGLVRAQDYGGRVLIHVIDSSPNPELDANVQFRSPADSWQSIKPEEFHYSKTRNLGVKAAETPMVLFLSADAHPVGTSWLSSLIEPIASAQAD